MTRSTFLKTGLAALVAAVTLGQAGTAMAANTANTTASARIVQAIAIVKDRDLSFGQIVAGASATVVTVANTSAGARTFDLTRAGGGAYNGGTAGTTSTGITSAQFTVSGYDNTTFSISLPSTVTLNGPSSATMTVSNLQHDAGTTPALVGGTKVFYLGADLTVAASQAAGAYTGAFDVTVDYQ